MSDHYQEHCCSPSQLGCIGFHHHICFRIQNTLSVARNHHCEESWPMHVKILQSGSSVYTRDPGGAGLVDHILQIPVSMGPVRWLESWRSSFQSVGIGPSLRVFPVAWQPCRFELIAPSSLWWGESCSVSLSRTPGTELAGMMSAATSPNWLWIPTGTASDYLAHLNF